MERERIERGERGLREDRDSTELPEEGVELLSATGRPGEVHTVVASIGRHHEATPPTGVVHPVVVDAEAEEEGDEEEGHWRLTCLLVQKFSSRAT